MSIVSFAVLPFVRVNTEVIFGPYKLWPNSTENWLSNVGSDESDFIEMYCDSEGNPRKDGASILTRTDGAQPNQAQWFDAVVCFSTASWLSELDGSGDSDPWVFEAWSFPAGTREFARIGKYSANYTDVDYDRFYPTPYTHLFNFNALMAEEPLNYLSGSINRQDERSNRLLTALGHLYRARLSTPYFSSNFDDVESIWSALESYFGFPRHLPFKDESPRAHFLRKYLPRFLADRLGYNEKPDRGKFAAQCVEDELHELVDDRRVLGDVSLIIGQLYRVRNAHTHGGQPSPAELVVERQDGHLVGLALFLWQVLLLHSISKENLFTKFTLQQRLQNRILEKRVHDSLLDQLKGRTRNDWCMDNGTPGNPDFLRRTVALIDDALSIDQRFITGRNKNSGPLAKIKTTIMLALSAWLGHLEATQPNEIYAATPVAGLRAEMKTIMEGKDNKADRLRGELDIVKSILRRSAHRKEAYGSSPPEIFLLGGLIPLWQWCSLIVRLEELYAGQYIYNAPPRVLR